MEAHLQSCYEVILNAPVAKVWDALVNPERIRQYFYGTNLETDWQVGHPLRFWGEYEGHAYEDKGVVMAFEPEQYPEYTYLSSWSGLPDVPENYLRIRQEVYPAPEGTRLVIRQTHYDAERLAHANAGWAQVTEAMKAIL